MYEAAHSDAKAAPRARMSATVQTSGTRGPQDRRHPLSPAKAHTMLRTLIGLLIILWLVGLATSYTLGGAIHVLLVIAIVILVVELLGSRRSL